MRTGVCLGLSRFGGVVSLEVRSSLSGVTLVESDSLGICPSWGKTLGNLSSSQGRTGKRQAGKVLYHDL